MPQREVRSTHEEVTITTHIDRARTYTTVAVELGGHLGMGTAKRNPTDGYDERVGYTLALGRALRDVADSMESTGHVHSV